MGEQQDVAVDPRVEAALDDPVRAHADLVDGLAACATARSRCSSPGSPRGCRRSSDPRTRRSPTRRGPGRRRRPANPASRAVSAARDSGLVSTSANAWPARRRPRASACSPPDVGQRDVGPARVAPEPRPLGLAVADEPDLAFRCARVAHSGGRPGGRVSSGVGGEELARRPAEDPGERQRRQRRDPRVVAVDLVVVELPPVGDHRLEPLDLVLQVEDVLLRLHRRVASTTANSERTAAEVASAWTAWSGIGSVGE